MRTAVLAAFAVALAGCLSAAPAALVEPAALAGVRVVAADGSPVPFVAATALGATGPLRSFSTDAAGLLDPALLPLGTERVLLAAPGHEVATVATPLPAVVALAPSAGAVDPADPTPVLRFLPPVALGGAGIVTGSAECAAYNCGLSEPSVEVAGDGTIYYSAVCCVGKTPPVWASRDGGATFTPLESRVRDLTGIEGDFAVDDAGNVYFTDILVGAGWFTSWDKDGAERYTLPIPFEPLVDRPWVRAGAEDVVYFAYNTARDTLFHRSTDGGRTWGLPLYRAGENLGDLGQGPDNEHLLIVTGDSELTLHETRDGGASWETETVPTPEGDGSVRDRRVPVVDEAGNVWVVYAWGAEGVFDVFAARRDPEGAWRDPVQVSAPGGTHAYPWPATLRDGTLAVAWYAAPWANVTRSEGGALGGASYSPAADDEWFLMVAASLDAGTDAPSFQLQVADPLPVAKGALGRQLLDFLQVDVSPDGALHIGYAAKRDAAAPEEAQYVRSTVGLALQPAMFPFGPMAGAGHEHAPGLRLPLS